MIDFARERQPNKLTFAKKIVPILLFTCTFTILFSTLFFLYTFTTRNESNTIISPLAEPLQETYQAIKGVFTSSLENQVHEAMKNTRGDYAIVIKHLKTNESFQQNENKQYTSASLYKLWLMGTAYTQISEGKLSLNDPISASAESLNEAFDIATESADVQAGSISMTVEDAIKNAITISDNPSALLLTSRVKVSSMKQFLKSNGMTKTNTNALPQTTANDIVLFYEKLYKKELVNAAASEQMLSLLKNQQLGDRIPKYLPQSIPVAHKTGELDGFKHDAGIVFSPAGDYIIVVLSHTNNPKEAAEVIALLSKKVYDYFNK